MSRKIVILSVLAVALSACNNAVLQKPLNQPPEGFVSLFNGRDLTGWEKLEFANEGKWEVEDGTIVGSQYPPGAGGLLSTEQEFKDFELTLETKIDWPFDSGVFLRMGYRKDLTSLQVTLDYRPEGEIGAIYQPGQGFAQHCLEGIKYFRKGQWNWLRIICQGEPAKIRVWLNDVLIMDFQNTEGIPKGIPKQGTICVQIHPGDPSQLAQSKVRFKNLFIREF